MQKIGPFVIFLLLSLASVCQNKQEEKDWLKVYNNLNSREIPEIREAHTSDIKALESFLRQYPENGMALYYLKSEVFHLMFWKGKYDSTYIQKYLDVLTRYINLPESAENGYKDKKAGKISAVFNRSQAYLLAHDTISACNDYMAINNYLETDTGPEAKKMKLTPGLEQQIELCKIAH